MTTKEAIKYILDHDNDANQYRLSKAFKCTHTTIKNYLDGKTNMSEKIHKEFIKYYPTLLVDDVVMEIKYKLGIT